MIFFRVFSGPCHMSMEVERICVLGCAGAGKSVLAAKLSALTDLPVISLDQAYWLEGWVRRPDHEWRRRYEELASQDQWIIDGIYLGTMERRLASADTAIYLDVPRYLCLFRVLLRTIRWWRRQRPEGPTGCRERFDRDFFHYVWNFRNKDHPRILAALTRHSSICKIVVVRNKRDYEDLIRSFSP